MAAYTRTVSGICLRVLNSAAGYYIGTVDSDGLPDSRESAEYFSTQAIAEYALETGSWTIWKEGYLKQLIDARVSTRAVTLH